MVLGASGVITSFVSCIEWMQYFNYSRAIPGVNCDNVLSQFSGDNLVNMAYVEM